MDCSPMLASLNMHRLVQECKVDNIMGQRWRRMWRGAFIDVPVMQGDYGFASGGSIADAVIGVDMTGMASAAAAMAHTVTCSS